MRFRLTSLLGKRILGLGSALLMLLAAGPAAAVQGAAAAHRDWNFEPTFAPGGTGPMGLTAVAARGGLVALGDEAGVQLNVAGAPYERVVRSGRVQDLEFGPDGTLWVSAADGVYRVAPDGRVSRESPGTGEEARLATRVRTASNVIAAATAGGLFLSRDGRSWTPRLSALPIAAVTALALRPSPAAESGGQRVEVFAVAGGFAWRCVVRVTANAARVVEAERISFVGRPTGVAPVDVVLDVPGADEVVVYPGLIAARSNDSGWTILRPVLPPGAEIRRLVHAAGHFWLLTDRGVLVAAGLDRVFTRAAPPAGTTPVSGLVAHADGVLVASEQGLLKGGPPDDLRFAQSNTQSLQLGPSVQSDDEPDISAIQSAALRYLGLDPARFRSLRDGLDRRGWLPVLSLRFDYAADRDIREDWDQSYVSGDTRKTYDYGRVRYRDMGGYVGLTWDLGDTVYNPDAIDLSREMRQRISLRDDALDEINQLYFERRRVLIAIGALPADADPVERERLKLRASELAAGLDGWTGGWFSRASTAGAR